MAGSSGRARFFTFTGWVSPTTWLTMLPMQPYRLCSSTVTMARVSRAAFSTASRSRGLTQYMSSTRAEMPCSASSAAASTAGLTISPQAMRVTSVPSFTVTALSIWKLSGTLSYTSSTALRPTRI